MDLSYSTVLDYIRKRRIVESHSEVNIKVSSNSTLVWIPGRQIVAQGCHHQAITRIDLEKGARLYAREEIMLGRHGEIPGALRQRIRVTYDGIACHDQELAVGAGAIGWESSAVTGGRRALGSIIIVDPDASNAIRCEGLGSAAIADTAVLKLNERTTLITSLAPDAIILGRQLDAAFAQYSRRDTAVGEAETDESSGTGSRFQDLSPGEAGPVCR